MPTEPVVFAVSTLQNPKDNVMLLISSQKIDWEVGLRGIVGTTARCVDEKVALGSVAGWSS
jgi:2-keto-4-pentenoate hydratase/2-oxohepta-3-ene-1,7-dioic acid hydratase in catechol pathway